MPFQFGSERLSVRIGAVQQDVFSSFELGLEQRCGNIWTAQTRRDLCMLALPNLTELIREPRSLGMIKVNGT